MSFPVELTEEQMLDNYKRLLEHVEVMFESRAEPLLKMYKDYEETVILAPASSIEHFHNAFPGGYLDHVLRVLEYAFRFYELWKGSGLNVDTFTAEELAFVAIHHDLGKLGLPGEGNERYIKNESEWHRKNQGKIYTPNPKIPFMTVTDMSLHILQRYGVPITLNEGLGIRLTDGLYDEVNQHYYITRAKEASLRTHLPHIMHQADMMASRFEYDRWAKASGNVLENYKDVV